MALSSHGQHLAGLFQRFADIGSFGAFGPLVGAIFVTIVFDGFSGLISLLKKGITVRVNLKLWIIALFLFPILIGGSMLITMFFGSKYTFPSEVTSVFIIPIVLVIIFFTGGPLQEEFGWRGVLLEELQKKLSPLISSLIVGIIWGIWHLPLFFVVGNGMYYAKPIWGLLLSTTLISILFTWLYNKSNKNLLLMLVFHTMFNFSHYMFPILQNDMANFIFWGFLIAIIAVLLYRKQLSTTNL